MKPRRLIAASLASLTCVVTALASDAKTSATAGSNSLRPTGTAAATARYEGDVGFARTNTRSGSVNAARGVAVGFDQSGLSLSLSQAVAPRSGPALATNFNLSIGRDGRVSGSTGVSLAKGPIHRSATAGGSAGTGLRQGATSVASGQTDRRGTVRVATRADDFRPRLRAPVSRRYEPRRSMVRSYRPVVSRSRWP